MSSPSRPKSPHGVTPKKDDKEESFWDKIGTLGRKKKIKEGRFHCVLHTSNRLFKIIKTILRKQNVCLPPTRLLCSNRNPFMGIVNEIVYCKNGEVKNKI